MKYVIMVYDEALGEYKVANAVITVEDALRSARELLASRRTVIIEKYV